MKKSLIPTLAFLALSLLGAVPARAAFTLTLQQVGANVVVTGSGSLNVSALTLMQNLTTTAFTYPDAGVLINGPTGQIPFSYYGGASFQGPASFGTGSDMETAASVGSGSFAGIDGGDKLLAVPRGYVSGAMLSSTDTYNNQTFASLGIVPGIYRYTWGSGASVDTLTIDAVVPVPVPEPSTWVGLGLGAIFLVLAGPRHRGGAV